MQKAIKWTAIIGGALVVLTVAILLILPFFIDLQKYKPMVEERVADATGRSFSIGGDLHVSLFPWAKVSFSDLRLGNLDGFQEKEFLTIDSFDVQVKLLPLLSKEIQVKRFLVKGPSLVLVKNRDGRGNWEMPASPAPAPETGEKTPAGTGKTAAELPLKKLAVGEFSITGGRLTWIDHAGGLNKTVSDINLQLENVSLDKPVDIHFSAVADRHPLSLDGQVGPLGAQPGKTDIAFDLAVKAMQIIAVQARGKVVQPAGDPAFDLALTVEELSPRKLMAALGQALPMTPSDPAVLNRFSLETKLSGTSRQVDVSNGRLRLDDTQITFSAAASDFARPVIRFDAVVDAIDLDRYLPTKGEKGGDGGKPAGKKTGSGEQPATDYGPLRRLDLDGTLKVGKCKAGNASASELLVKTRARDGVIRIDPLSLNLYQGVVKSLTVLDVRQNTPKMDLDLNIAGVQIGPLLKDAARKDVLEGTTVADIQVQATGDNPEQIKKTLNGKGEIRFENGAVVGIDLANMARNVQSAFGLAEKGAARPRTDFSELLLPFSIENGRFHTPGTVLKSPFLRLLAKGDADLVAETLDFRVEPKAVATMKGQGDTEDRAGLMVPILVRGTFADPKFRPDLKGILGNPIDKVLPQETLKPIQETTKGLLKSLFQ